MWLAGAGVAAWSDVSPDAGLAFPAIRATGLESPWSRAGAEQEVYWSHTMRESEQAAVQARNNDGI